MQGDPADAVFYIEKGKVQLTVISDQGKEGVIAMPSAEECLSARRATIRTLIDLLLLSAKRT